MSMPFTDYSVIAYYLNKVNTAEQSIVMGKSDLWNAVKRLDSEVYDLLVKRESIPNISAENKFKLSKENYNLMFGFFKNLGFDLSSCSHFRLAFLYAVMEGIQDA